MIWAWLLTNPARAAAIIVIAGLLAGLGVQMFRLHVAESRLAVAEADRTLAQAAARACSDGVAAIEADARRKAQEAAKAVAAARRDSATRQPQIDALREAEKAPAATLTCGDAVERVRDALGR